MAHIRSGSIVSDIRGKVGTEIYSRNRGGAYVKAYAAPVQPGSSLQTTQSSFFASAVTAWQALTEAEKSEWDLFANNLSKKSTFGVKQNSGRNLFIGSAVNRQNIDATITGMLPRLPGDIPQIDISGTWPAGTKSAFTITVTVSFGTDDFAIMLRMSDVLSANIRSFNSTRTVNIMEDFLTQNDSQNIRGTYEGVFGSKNPATGEKVFAEYRIIHQLSGVHVGTLREIIVIS